MIKYVEKNCESGLARLTTLQRRHNGHDGVSNHQPYDCLLNRLFRPRSQKSSKFRVTGLCEGNSPVTGEFLAQRASNAANASIWWRYRENYHNCSYRRNNKQLLCDCCISVQYPSCQEHNIAHDRSTDSNVILQNVFLMLTIIKLSRSTKLKFTL